MKIILSRKGFDSAAGGIASPIMPNGDMISFPIPTTKNNEYYKDIKYKNTNLKEIMKQLSNRIRVKNKLWISTDEDYHCHLDPDIVYESVKRTNGWKGALGQVNAPQKHLENQGVEVGDIFIFFGWFRDTKYNDGKLEYTNDSNGKHVMFGYLEIGEIVKLNNDSKVDGWLQNHPHNFGSRKDNKTNTVYIASDTLSFNNSLKGYGTFKYSDELALTKEGESRTRWNLPDIFRKVNISYHTEASWKDKYFQSAARGQEFVIDASEEIVEWFKNIIENNVK